MADVMAATAPVGGVARLAGLACAALLMAAGQAGAERIAVVSQDAGSVAEIDAGVNTLAATIKLGKGPAELAVSSDGRMLYVTYPDGGRIGIIDARSGKIVRDLPFVGQPFGIAAGGGAVYVSDWSKNSIERLGLNPGTPGARVAVGKSPAGLALDAAGHRLYAANRESGTVTVIDTLRMRAIAAIGTGNAPYALTLSPDARQLFVVNVRSGDLAVIDTVRLRRVARIQVGSMPYGLTVTPDGKIVLITLQHGDRVVLYDARTLRSVGSINVGRYPEGVVAAGHGRAYVTNWFSGDVSVIDLAARREIARIKVGDGPRGLAVITGAQGDRP